MRKLNDVPRRPSTACGGRESAFRYASVGDAKSESAIEKAIHQIMLGDGRTWRSCHWWGMRQG
jgi:hypothetical protein